MSSLFGHSLMGASLFARQHPIDSVRAGGWCLFMIGLAVSLDVDYLLRWFLHFTLNPRYTHSLTYCLTISSLAWGLNTILFRQWRSPLSTALLFFAPLSHLLLDLLVGVYPMPLFWPFSAQLIVLPFGILPSAGKLSVTNYYMWRNLLIEMGILLPLLIFITPRWRTPILNHSRYRHVLLFSVFVCFVIIGIHLKR